MTENKFFYEELQSLLKLTFIGLGLINLFSNPWGLYFTALGIIFYEAFFTKKKPSILRFIFSIGLSGILYFIFKGFNKLSYFYLQKNEKLHLILNSLKSHFYFKILDYEIFYFLFGFAMAYFLGSKVCKGFNKIYIQYKNFFTKSPKEEGIVLGVGKNGKKFIFSDENLFLHTQIIGAPGSGKTNIIKYILEHRIKKNKAVIFIDYKGEIETLNWITNCLKFYGKREDLRLLSISENYKSIDYNPISGGTPAQIASRIMSSLNWSESFYKDYSENALKEILYIVSKNADYEISVLDIKDILASKKFFEMLNSKYKFINEKEEKEALYKKIYSAEGRRNTLGLFCQLENLCLSPVAKNLKQNQEEGILDFIRNKRFVYFQMNSMLDAGTSRLLGKLLLSDLIFQVGREFDLNEAPSLDCLLCIDEFSAFATSGFLNLLDRARGAGLAIMVSHQNSADTEKISPEYAKSIESNTSNKIIFGTSLHDEAEKFARYLGTTKSKKQTFQTIRSSPFQDHVLGEKGSVRESEEFIVHPNKIKNLSQGEALVIKRFINPDHAIVKLPMATKYPPK